MGDTTISLTRSDSRIYMGTFRVLFRCFLILIEKLHIQNERSAVVHVHFTWFAWVDTSGERRQCWNKVNTCRRRKMTAEYGRGDSTSQAVLFRGELVSSTHPA